jgi:hypothetical protein
MNWIKNGSVVGCVMFVWCMLFDRSFRENFMGVDE